MFVGLGAMQGTTLHLRVTNLKLFRVTHSCMAFTASCKCLYGVEQMATKNQVVDKECSEDVPGNLRWQLVDLLIQTANAPHVGVPSFG